jgi:signal transduction histidine kinase/ActR/RegA family two-component response regulator
VVTHLENERIESNQAADRGDAPSTRAAASSARSARHHWLRPLSIVAFALFALSSVGTSLVLQRVVDDQEQRLLRERAAEGAAFLSTMMNQTSSSLTLLGFVVDMAPDDIGRFDTAAARMLGSAPGTVALVDEREGDLTVLGATDSALSVGTVLGDERAALARRALRTPGMVADKITDGDRSFLAFALASGGASSRVLYQETPFDPTTPLRGDDDSPFSELDGALYASSTADPDKLVITTTSELPITGRSVERRTVEIGVEKWSLVVKARRSLVGSFAANTPWGVLGAGLLGSLLVAALVEVVSRRRAYALALVDERTGELRRALEEKARLEEGERQAREAAEAANQSKNEFLSRMSHELRTPLNAVLGFAQLLELDELTEQQQDWNEQILHGGRHLLNLINEVLDITNIEAGHLAISAEPVLVRHILEDVTSLVAPLATERGVTIVRDTSRDTSEDYVQADVQRLKQILLNLLSNAVKYNKPNGLVTLSYERPTPELLRINVADTGLGIAADQLDLLFTPFERLGAESSGIEGTGIGLALSLRLAEAMGATLDVATTPGEGSTFSLQLSAVDAPSVKTSEPQRKDAVGDKKRVVYIEDNLSNLRLLEAVLGDVGIEVVPAMQGRIGLELARELRPSLVLLDKHLPDMNGIEVLRRLRADPATASIPVVIVTADATEGRAERLLAAGASAHLTKPIDVRELRTVIADLGARRT